MDTRSESTTGKRTIYYDGTCTLCSGLVDRLVHSKAGASLIMKDVSLPHGELPSGITPEAAHAEVHVVDGKGRVLGNIDGIFSILELYPALRPFVSILRLPGIRHALKGLYRIIAKHRHSISALLAAKKR